MFAASIKGVRIVVCCWPKPRNCPPAKFEWVQGTSIAYECLQRSGAVGQSKRVVGLERTTDSIRSHEEGAQSDAFQKEKKCTPEAPVSAGKALPRVGEVPW